jgi:hypothetical protein
MEGISSADSTRTPRFRRVAPPPFALMPRDLEILQAVAGFGVIQSSQLERLLPGSPQRLRRRLKLLFNAGYLARPRSQVAAMIAGKGSAAMAYTLTRRGAALVPGESGVTWYTQDGELSQLLHRLAITEFLVSMTVGCRESEHLEFVPSHAVIASSPAETRAASIPDRWQVSVRYNGTSQSLHLRADGLFAVRHRELRAAGRPSDKHFFLEIDKGTMPITRPALSQSSILRKLLAYGATFRAEIHKSRFAMTNMRVLFVTETPERASHMVDAYKAHAAHAAPAGLFLFTDRVSLAAVPTILSTTWLDGEGRERRLFHQ